MLSSEVASFPLHGPGETMRCARLAALWILAAAGMTAQQPPPAHFPQPENTPPAAPAPVQNTGQALPTLKLSTRLVVIDVVVTDKHGHLVNNLQKNDFSVYEDGAVQAIRSFEPPSAHAQPAGVVVNSAADLKKIGFAPVTILVMDELNTDPADMSGARQALVKYLASQPATLTQPTELLVATNTRFLELHDYTQNRDALIDLIRHHLPELPTKFLAGRGGCIAVERMVQSLASLEQIAQASLGTPGRKNVIWVGAGFPSSNPVGLDDKTATTIIAAVRQCTNMLLDARITMYVIDPRINSTDTIDVSDPDDISNEQTSSGVEPFAGAIQFATFAPATGGHSYFSRNDLNNEIAEGIEQGNDYYTLSYVPTDNSDNAAKYRQIRIVMGDKNLRATTRDGYYPPTAAIRNVASTEPPRQAANQLKLDISSAVNSAISYNGLDIQATRGPGDYSLAVGAGHLDWTPVDNQTQRAEATVIAAWYNAKGKLLGHAGKELVVTRPADTDPDHPGDATFVLPLQPLPGDATRLRFVVRDAVSGRMGTADVKP